MPLPVRRRESSSVPQRYQRWEPFRELEQLQEATAQLLENVWSGEGIGAGQIWIPNVDIEESDDAWVVEAELPGAKQDDISVELQDNDLAITGEIKERERKGVLRRRTRRTGQFEYRVTLPGSGDPDGVDANLHGGVLTVRVPKAEQPKPQRIEVTSNGSAT